MSEAVTDHADTIRRFLLARRTFPKRYGWRLLWAWAKDKS